MAEERSQYYTIAQAAALTGLHRNTIRMKVKAGQIAAEVKPGKFGEEYRISRHGLIEVGLLDETDTAEDLDDSEVLVPILHEEGATDSLRAALRDLFLHHENAMFRMGYMEAELERSKALAAEAESLQDEHHSQELELKRLRQELERSRSREAEIEELRSVLTEMEGEMERLRAEVEGYRAEEERRRRWQFWRR